MTARLPFTEQTIRRALTAARKNGLRVVGFTVKPDGSVTVHSGDSDATVVPSQPSAVNDADALEDWGAEA